MRFADEPQPAPYLNRKDQRRLLAMVGVLSLVVFAVSWAARPETWYWLIPPDNDSAQNTAADSPEAMSPQNVGDFVDPGAIAMTNSNPPEATQPENEKVTLQQSQAHSGKTALPNLPAQWLESISDQEIGIPAKEADTYYRTLAHISRLDERYLDKHALKNVLHVNLLNSPDQYRGKLITIRGMARRISEVRVVKNQYGVKQTYEAWVLTPDSGNDPLRIVAGSIDPRLPTGEKVAVQIEVTGYFLKLYSYSSPKGHYVAPLILAARIKPYTVVKSVPSSTGLEPYIIMFALVVGLGTIITVSLYSRGDRKFKKKLDADFPDKNIPPENFLEQLQDNENSNSLFS